MPVLVTAAGVRFSNQSDGLDGTGLRSGAQELGGAGRRFRWFLRPNGPGRACAARGSTRRAGIVQVGEFVDEGRGTAQTWSKDANGVCRPILPRSGTPLPNRRLARGKPLGHIRPLTSQGSGFHGPGMSVVPYLLGGGSEQRVIQPPPQLMVANASASTSAVSRL